MNYTLKNNTDVDYSIFSELIQKFFPFAQKRMGFNRPVDIALESNIDNANNPLGKTAYYEPLNYKIVLYTDNRHPKDILRSLSHELVHHTQNCNGHFKGDDVTEEGYAQTNPHLRNMEKEAFLKGNMIFRDWCDHHTNKSQGERLMNEQQIKEIIKGAIKRVVKESNILNKLNNVHEKEEVPENQNSVQENSLDEDHNEEELEEVKEEGFEKGESEELEEEVAEEAPEIQEEGVVKEAADCEALNRETGKAREYVDEAEQRGVPGEVHAAHAQLKTALENYKAGGCGQLEEDKEEEKPLKEWWSDKLYKKLLKEYTRDEKDGQS